MYPPSLSFTVVYDTALKYNGRGQPSVVKFFCDGTTAGRLHFSTVVYEEKGKILSLKAQYCDVHKSRCMPWKSLSLPFTWHHLIENQGREARGVGSLSLQGSHIHTSEIKVTGP